MLRFETVKIVQGAFELSADFALERGTRTALLGGSGEGKSTLLNLVAGFLDAVEGQVLWDGASLTGKAPPERPVTILFQDHNLFGHLTAAQNVALGIAPSLRLDRAGWARVDEVLAKVGLGDLGQRRPADLSGGQQSRVALARALVRERDLWLLDEPFAALGPGLRQDMLELVARTATEAGATVLLVTHDPEDARRFADQVVLIGEGQAQPPRATAALFADPPPELRRYLGT